MIFIMSDDSLTFKYMYKWLSYMGSFFFFLPSANSARKGRDGGGGVQNTVVTKNYRNMTRRAIRDYRVEKSA